MLPAVCVSYKMLRCSHHSAYLHLTSYLSSVALVGGEIRFKQGAYLVGLTKNQVCRV